jgi:hypothetical protein
LGRAPKNSPARWHRKSRAFRQAFVGSTQVELAAELGETEIPGRERVGEPLRDFFWVDPKKLALF